MFIKIIKTMYLQLCKSKSILYTIDTLENEVLNKVLFNWLLDDYYFLMKKRDHMQMLAYGKSDKVEKMKQIDEKNKLAIDSLVNEVKIYCKTNNREFCLVKIEQLNDLIQFKTFNVSIEDYNLMKGNIEKRAYGTIVDNVYLHIDDTIKFQIFDAIVIESGDVKIDGEIIEYVEEEYEEIKMKNYFMIRCIE